MGLRRVWGFDVCGALGGLVQGSQQVTALEEVQVALQRHVDLTVVTGQLRETGGLKRWAEQTVGYTWRTTEKERMIRTLRTHTWKEPPRRFNDDVTHCCGRTHPHSC